MSAQLQPRPGWQPAKPGDTPGQYPPTLLQVAQARGVEPRALDWHVEAVHGCEPHDEDYAYGCDVAADCLTSGICTMPRCTCQAGRELAAVYGPAPAPGQGRHRHAIDCLITAAGEPCAMIGFDRSIFYPDNPDDAARIATEHRAVPVDKERHTAWLAACADDPTPTTGGPYQDDRPPGCGCHWREYTDVGDTRYAQPGGCPVHTPWAFPGYTLAEDTG